MGFGSFSSNNTRTSNNNRTSNNKIYTMKLLINNKYYNITDLYSYGVLPIMIIKIDIALSIDDLMFFITWENSIKTYSADVYKKKVLLTSNGKAISVLIGTYPIINENEGYIEIRYDSKNNLC